MNKIIIIVLSILCNFLSYLSATIDDFIQLYNLPPELLLNIAHQSNLVTYDKKLKSYFIAEKYLNQHPMIPLISNASAEQTIVDLSFKNNDKITQEFPKGMNNTQILGPNHNNHLIIDNIFFNGKHRSLQKVPWDKTEDESVVVIHPSKPLVCNIKTQNRTSNIYVYNLSDNCNYYFNQLNTGAWFPTSPDSYSLQVFFGPKINDLPTLWIKPHLPYRDDCDQIRLYDTNNKVLKTVPKLDKDGQTMYFKKYHCSPENSYQLLIQYSTTTLSTEQRNNNTPVSVKTLFYDAEYDHMVFDPVPQELCNTINFNTTYLNFSTLTFLNNHTPQYDYHYKLLVAKKKDGTIQDWLLATLKKKLLAWIIKEYVDQISHASISQEELVELIRNNPDRWEIIARMSTLYPRVKDFFKTLNNEFKQYHASH